MGDTGSLSLGAALAGLAILTHTLGWTEVTIVARFWIVAGTCVPIGLAIFYGDWVVTL